MKAIRYRRRNAATICVLSGLIWISAGVSGCQDGKPSSTDDLSDSLSGPSENRGVPEDNLERSPAGDTTTQEEEPHQGLPQDQLNRGDQEELEDQPSSKR